MRVKWLNYVNMPLDKVLRSNGTPFIEPSKVILTAPPTTAIGNYPPLFAPYQGYMLSTSRVLLTPDEGVNELRLERAHVQIRGSQVLQAVTGRVPAAGGDLDRAIEIALREISKLEALLKLLYYAMMSEAGLLTYLLKFTLGASGCGWAIPWNQAFMSLLELLPRRIFKVMLCQVSMNLRVSDEQLERRIHTLRELMTSFDVRLFYSYPCYYRGPEIHVDPLETKRRINDIIAFMEYIASQERSDVARQLTDLKILIKGGTIGYTLSTVLGPLELGAFQEDPTKIKLLSPIPIKIERNDEVALLAMTSSRRHAERYVEDFQRTFHEAIIVATYSEVQVAEPRFLLAIPITLKELEECLTQMNKNPYLSKRSQLSK